MIKKKSSVLLVINLLNGSMRTPKIEALHRMINWFNLHYNYNIPLLGLDTIPLQSNYWLAGFIDADGSFYFNFVIGKKGLPINLQYYMRITQKQEYKRINNNLALSYFSIMNAICTYLSVLYFL